MNAKLSSGSGLRPWKCAHGHTLGMVQRVEVDEGGRRHWVTRLMLFRRSIDLEQDRVEDVDVIAVLEGTTLDVRCSACGDMRSWFIGDEAMQHLLGRVLKRQEVMA